MLHGVAKWIAGLAVKENAESLSPVLQFLKENSGKSNRRLRPSRHIQIDRLTKRIRYYNYLRKGGYYGVVELLSQVS